MAVCLGEEKMESWFRKKEIVWPDWVKISRCNLSELKKKQHILLR